ncbi:MAG: DNA/RNA nuclease SfsA [bacterium]|jgi:sugar fermentation stimulation protein A
MTSISITLPSLKKGHLIVRPNRFLAHVDVEGREILAHVADPGRLNELLFPGAEVYVSAATNPNRKTAFDLKLVQGSRGLVSVDSGMPNRLAKIALEAGVWPAFTGYDNIKSEPRYKNSRFDFLLHGHDKPDCYLEVKGCTLVEDGVALFPDAPTARGTRQVGELTELVGQGARAAVIFIIQRQDVVLFRPHTKMDPAFSRTLYEAQAAGVEVLAYRCSVTQTEIRLDTTVEIEANFLG